MSTLSRIPIGRGLFSPAGPAHITADFSPPTDDGLSQTQDKNKSHIQRDVNTSVCSVSDGSSVHLSTGYSTSDKDGFSCHCGKSVTSFLY